MTDKMKKPTEAQIMTGYMLHRARRKSVKYAWRARECLLTAATETKEAGDLRAVVDVEDLSGRIISAAGAFETALAEIHQTLIEKMEQAGYDAITDDDFKKFGGGGSR